jgi:hypothetical protein
MVPETKAGFKAGVKDYRLTSYNYVISDTDILAALWQSHKPLHNQVYHHKNVVLQ